MFVVVVAIIVVGKAKMRTKINYKISTNKKHNNNNRTTTTTTLRQQQQKLQQILAVNIRNSYVSITLSESSASNSYSDKLVAYIMAKRYPLISFLSNQDSFTLQ